MAHELLMLPRAVRELRRLPKEDYEKACNAVRQLAQSPRPAGCKKLIARNGWRLRVGNYRIVYEIDGTERTVTSWPSSRRLSPMTTAFFQTEIDP